MYFFNFSGQERREGRGGSGSHFALLVYALKSCAKANHLVHKLAGIRMDHYHHHHFQLCRHGFRRQTPGWRQNRVVFTDGKKLVIARIFKKINITNS